MANKTHSASPQALKENCSVESYPPATIAVGATDSRLIPPAVGLERPDDRVKRSATPRHRRRHAASTAGLVVMSLLTVTLPALVRPAEAADASTTVVSIPAAVVHDAVYSAIYFERLPAQSEVEVAVLQDVVNLTYGALPHADPSAVNTELAALRRQLESNLGGGLSFAGPTDLIEVTRAASVLVTFARSSSATLTRTASAAAAADLYRSYPLSSITSYNAQGDRYAGLMSQSADTRPPDIGRARRLVLPV